MLWMSFQVVVQEYTVFEMFDVMKLTWKFIFKYPPVEILHFDRLALPVLAVSVETK